MKFLVQSSMGKNWVGPFLDPFFENQSLFKLDSFPINIQEGKESYLIEAELPGIEEKDVEVTIDGRVLTIKVERQQEEEGKEKKLYLLRERHEASLRRSFNLPKDIDSNKIEASFKNGVLSITLARRESKPKVIKIA